MSILRKSQVDLKNLRLGLDLQKAPKILKKAPPLKKSKNLNGLDLKKILSKSPKPLYKLQHPSKYDRYQRFRLFIHFLKKSPKPLFLDHIPQQMTLKTTNYRSHPSNNTTPPLLNHHDNGPIPYKWFHILNFRLFDRLVRTPILT